ncbi:hypothetical protein IWW56_001357 [Coemansia sp. RSA 2131]|nr:hypothetical protein IWW56_001357 [Coemansia sp. RSA 2131]
MSLHILRWVLDGRILLSFKPPGFFRDFAYLKELAVEETQASARSSDSASDVSDNETVQPIAQQSMFALLDEENC